MDCLGELSRAYDLVTEAEFRTVRKAIVRDATRTLRNLHDTKRSPLLPTAAFYEWLLNAIASVPVGTRVWAVSFMLDCEWDESESERNFLRLNIDAVNRGVYLERVFIVSGEVIERFLSNPGVKAHLEMRGEYCCTRVVGLDALRHADPAALRGVGQGLIAFDQRVAQIDVAVPGEGICGVVTMDHAEIANLRRAFDGVVAQAEDLADFARRMPNAFQ